MLAGRAGEIVSRRETPSQCGRVGSPVLTLLDLSAAFDTAEHDILINCLETRLLYPTLICNGSTRISEAGKVKLMCLVIYLNP